VGDKKFSNRCNTTIVGGETSTKLTKRPGEKILQAKRRGGKTSLWQNI